MARKDRSLVFDDIGRIEPGLHALLIGVSRYPRLSGGDDMAEQTYGLGQLDSPARTIGNIAASLLDMRNDLTPPLKTLRVLASPSDGEGSLAVPSTPTSPERLLRDLPGATLANVQDAAKRWRDDASRCNDDATLFYFAGHGIQRSLGDAILLLEDFLSGATVLDHAVDINNIYNGMANPSQPGMARQQIFVVDACRTSLSALRRLEMPPTASVFDIDLGGTDDRVAPIFLSAAAGHVAFGADGGLSLFGQDFIRCFSGGAAECLPDGDDRAWFLTIGELAKALRTLVDISNSRSGGKARTFDVAKYVASLETRLRRYAGPPLVECRFLVNPEDARAATALVLTDHLDRPVHKFPGPPFPHPYEFQVSAGHYRAAARMGGDLGGGQPYAHVPEFITVKPPMYEHKFTLRPQA